MDVAVARQGRGRRVVGVQHRVAHPGFPNAADVRHDVPDLTGPQGVGLVTAKLEIANLRHLVPVGGMGREGDLHAGRDGAVHHADAGDGAPIAVVV